MHPRCAPRCLGVSQQTRALAGRARRRCKPAVVRGTRRSEFCASAFTDSLSLSGRVSAVRNGQAAHLAKLFTVLVECVRHVDAVPRRRWTTKANRRSGREEDQSKTNHVAMLMIHNC